MSSMNADLSPSYLVVSGPLRRDEARTRSSLIEERHRAKTDSPKKNSNVDFGAKIQTTLTLNKCTKSFFFSNDECCLNKKFQNSNFA